MTKSSSIITGLILANQINSQLEAALDSLGKLGPVILLDTSPEQRCAKLRRPNLRVIHQSTPRAEADFAAWRNQLIGACESEWFFFLDSDEVIDQAAELVIKDYLENWTSDQPPLAALQRVDYFWGEPLRHGETGNNWQIRLGRKREVKFEGRVHERATIGGRVPTFKRLTGQIKHTAHPSLHQFLESVSWYADLASERRAGSRPRVLAELLTYPTGKFLLNYFWKRGWQDGWRGLIYALVMSHHSLWVRIYCYEKNFTQ